jgi:molecular chaperone HtpG
MSDDKALQISNNALQDLVDQFSDPYAFLRELVQNAIDAGSNQVYVRFVFIPNKDNPEGTGILTLHVEDTGEGMTRHIIDTQLTRLFSSSKEDDYTKIGKFGIGFVSVFALRPEAVVVDTGRDGESWRIFFEKDRSFKRLILDRPVEGTQVQLVLQATPEEFKTIRQRSVTTLIHWCKHAESEIFVDGEPINLDFSFAHPLAVTFESQGTTVALMPSLEAHPLMGFYNRGLTLFEGTQDEARGYAYKLRSRYLEHTLTRDNVLRDKNYDKAMGILSQAVEQRLLPGLLAAYAQTEADDALFGYLSFFLKKSALMKLPAARIPTVSGQHLSLAEARKRINRQKELLWDDGSNRVTDALQATGTDVFLWRGPDQEPGLGMLLRALAERRPLSRVNQVYAVPVLIADLSASEQQLLDLAGEMLHRVGSHYKQLLAGDLTYPGCGLADSLYVVQETPGALQRTDRRDGGGLFGFLLQKLAPKTLVVNLRHPLIEPHFGLDRSVRPLAAYLLAKSITLDEGLAADTEAKLLELAMGMEKRN